MDLKQHIKSVLDQVRVIQLATVRDGQPWCCNVHAYTDDDMSIYWVSRPDRRHSKEIADNPHVGAAAALRLVKPLLGLQIEGQAAVVTDRAVVDRIMRLYAERHGSTPAWVDEIVSGKNPHKLYRLAPSAIAVVDQVTFPDPNDFQQIWRP